MLRSKLVLIALLAAAPLVGCGVEAGESAQVADPSTTTASPEEERTPESAPSTTEPLSASDEAAIEAMADAYEDLGFTPEEARCVAEGIQSLMDQGAGGQPSVGDTMAIFNGCDIALDRMGEITEGIGDNPDEILRSSLAAGFRSAGLDEADAECLADAYIDEFGTDPTAAADPAALDPLLAACDISYDDFTN